MGDAVRAGNPDGSGAELFAGFHRMNEADPVQAVIHGHPLFHLKKRRTAQKMGKKRQEQKAVGHRPAQRSPGRPVRVHVDPLTILADLGEIVDSRLSHLHPGRNADFLTQVSFQFP